MNDPPALAAAAHRLLDEPGLRDRLVIAAKARAIAEFDHHAMARRSVEIYRRALDRAARFHPDAMSLAATAVEEAR
jgi:rhamnosyl/mannosyltransferase